CAPAGREPLARLRDACAEDRLSLDTFVRRLDLLYAARTSGELRALIAALPKPQRFGRQLGRLSRTLAHAAVVSLASRRRDPFAPVVRWPSELCAALLR